MNKTDKKRIFKHLIQFFIIGLVMGVVEDLIAISFATNAVITPHIFKVAFLVALPFSVISEIIIDFQLVKKVLNHLK